MDGTMSQEAEYLVHRAAQIIYDKKGINILGLNVRGLSTLTDYFIIAEGNVERHVRALGQAVVKEFKEQGIHPMRVEGERTGDWMVVDYGELIIHLFKPGLRQHYHLEHLWKEGTIIDLEIQVPDAKVS